jgi:NAD(P)H-dependent flavin oxidoreductase YrpB (nitropropane dioxygenase family)
MGMEVSLFAFTRSKEVVVEVSCAGGMGVLGAIAMSPEELEADLDWIDAHIEGKPYGVDTVMPMSYEGRGQEIDKDSLASMIPQKHREFVANILDEYAVGELPDDYETHESLLGWSVEKGMQHVEVSLKHPIALLANALGTPPKECIEMAHAHGVKVAALCGKKKQAVRHHEAGVDIIVAQGWEAGGHTGEIAGMILCPEIVDAVGDTPVVMAGGIGCGRQMAAAMSLGAQGVWTGSIWLTVAENQGYHPDAVTTKLLASTSADTVRSRCISGKPARQLKTEWTQLWDGPESPGTLLIPLQWMVQSEAVERIYHHEVGPLVGSPVGQIVGRMNEVQTTAELMADLVSEYDATIARLSGLEG